MLASTKLRANDFFLVHSIKTCVFNLFTRARVHRFLMSSLVCTNRRVRTRACIAIRGLLACIRFHSRVLVRIGNIKPKGLGAYSSDALSQNSDASVYTTGLSYPEISKFKMARLSLESRKKVIALHSRGCTVSEIRQRLREVNTSVSLQAIYNLLRKVREKNILIDMPRISKERKITVEMRAAIEEMYNGNDELTSTRIKCLLTERWPDLQVSIPTIKRMRKEMGWVCTRPHYCQLLRPVSCVSCCTCLF